VALPIVSVAGEDARRSTIAHSTSRAAFAKVRAMSRTLLLLALVALLFPGCKDKAKEQRKADLRALMHGLTADPDITAAMDKARANSGQFLAALQKPAANQRQFMVRKAFPAKDAKQQILWVVDLTFDGTLLHGRVDDNTSQPGSGLPKDGRVSFPPSDICDWMFNEDGKAVGGYMLRALKNKMTEGEWAKITAQISFKD
jgi:uncharacterized protein YegJ (DUF2314 family)